MSERAGRRPRGPDGEAGHWTRAPRLGAGQVLLALGVTGCVLGALQRFGEAIPPAFGDWLLIALFLMAAIAGAGLTWRHDHPRTHWSPTRPGRRFNSAVLYTRQGCPLCDEAHELLSRYSRHLPELIVVDIDADPTLRDKFDTCVPVVEFDGRVRFRGIVSEPLLRRLLEGTPPAGV